MSSLVDYIQSRPLVLFNESFASTNEREGSEIARRIVAMLQHTRVKVAYVTHMYVVASGLQRDNTIRALFLRAEREPDGRCTFRLTQGAPRSTSYGPDLYQEVFAAGAPN